MFDDVLNTLKNAIGGAAQDVERALGMGQPAQPQQQQAPSVQAPRVNIAQLTQGVNNSAPVGFYPSIQDQIDQNNQRQGSPWGVPGQQVQVPQTDLAGDTMADALKGIGADAVSPFVNIYQAAHNAAQPGTSTGQKVEDFIRGVTTPEQPAINLAGQVAAQATGKAQPTVNGPVQSFSKTPILQTAGNILGTAAIGLSGGEAPETAGEAAGATEGEKPSLPPESAKIASGSPQSGQEATNTPPEQAAVQEMQEAGGKPTPPELPTEGGYGEAAKELLDQNDDEYTSGRVGGTQVVQGRVEAGQIAAQHLMDQVNADLPKASDRQLLGDYLDDPTTEVSPKVKAVADQVKPLLDQMSQIRQAADPNFNPRVNYFTRAMEGDTEFRGPKFDTTTPTKGGAASQYNVARNVDKFTNTDTGDEYVGTPQELKLKEEGETGQYIDENGHAYVRSQATRPELRQAGIKIENDSSKVLGKYFADTIRLKEHFQYLNALSQKAGLDMSKMTPEQVANAKLEGYRATNIRGLQNILFKPETADALEAMSRQGPQNLLYRAYMGMTNILRDIAVTNPIVHPLNLEAQGALAAGNPLEATSEVGRQITQGFDLTKDPDYIEMKKAGGTGMGLTKNTFFGRNLGRAGRVMDEVNPVNINRAVVDKADEAIRLSVYKELKSQGYDPRAAVARINKFMGDYGAGLGKNERFFANASFFYRWLKTEATTLQTTGMDALHGKPGTLVTMAMIGTALWGAEQEWKKLTGNPNASIRYPGVFGLIKDVVELPGQVLGGQEPNLISGHTNPLVNIGLQEIANDNFYTGQPIVPRGANPFTNAEDRAKFAFDQTLGESAEGKFANGNKSMPEKIANFFGFTTPHVKGAPAAPNIPAFNMKGAKPVAGADKTGIQQADVYYKAKGTLMDTVGGDTKASDAVNTFIDHDKDSQNRTILDSSQQTGAGWAGLAANSKALRAIQKYETSITNDPEPAWKLTGARLQTWARYKSLAPGDPEKDALAQQNPWINTINTEDEAWINKQTFSGNTVNAPGYVPYPNISSSANDALNQIDNLAKIPAAQRTQAQMTQLTNLENNPEVQQTYQALDTYTNAVRQQWGLTPINYGISESQAVSNWSAQYEAASTAQRKTLRAQNPTMYAAMNQAYENSDLTSLEKQASIAYLSGQPSNELLSAIYSLGTYDVNKTANANGTNTYSLTNFNNTPLNSSGEPVLNAVNGYAPGSGSSGSSSGSSKSGGSDFKLHAINVHNEPIRGRFGRPTRIQMKFKVQHVKPGKRIAPTEAPPPKGVRPKNSGIQTTDDTIKTT